MESVADLNVLSQKLLDSFKTFILLLILYNDFKIISKFLAWAPLNFSTEIFYALFLYEKTRCLN